MFNRSLVLSLFFVSVVDVATFDGYVIVVIFSVVSHQIVFHFINEQRSLRTGLDNGKLGKLIKKNNITLGCFVAFNIILPSSVVFLRNFHVPKAKISFWVIWVNGFSIIFAAFLFWIIKVSSEDKLDSRLSSNYIAALIYIFSANTIPFGMILYGRTKKRFANGLYIQYISIFLSNYVCIHTLLYIKKRKKCHQILKKQ